MKKLSFGGKVTKQTVAEYIKRTLVLVVGLFIMSFGVALSVKAELGTSPISSVPYVLNIITGLSVGTTTIIANTIIVLIQIPILRRKFKPWSLLQIAVCVVFGLLTDLAMLCVDNITLTAYWQQWLVRIAGIVLVALGVSFEVTANVMTLAGEGLVMALCTVLPKVKFGYMKVAVDVSLVVIAVALSFIFYITCRACAKVLRRRRYSWACFQSNFPKWWGRRAESSSITPSITAPSREIPPNRPLRNRTPPTAKPPFPNNSLL